VGIREFCRLCSRTTGVAVAGNCPIAQNVLLFISEWKYLTQDLNSGSKELLFYLRLAKAMQVTNRYIRQFSNQREMASSTRVLSGSVG